MTDQERQRLAAILGMLGSDHAGERDNAATMAEEFRRQHGLTWEELLRTKYIVVPRVTYVDQHGTVEPEPVQPVGIKPRDWRKAVLLACFWTAILVGALAVH